MCWMFKKEAGKQVNFKYMDKAQKHNADGYGVSWYENEVVNTYKTFNYNQFKGFVAALKQHTIVVHLRYATKGAKSFDNIHPFDVPSGVMFHNGTMYGLGNGTVSDSRTLANTITKCDYNYIEDIEPLIEPFIDDKINRLVFFEDNGRVTIMNAELGITEDGIWYSNDYHLKADEWCRSGSRHGTCNANKVYAKGSELKNLKGRHPNTTYYVDKSEVKDKQVIVPSVVPKKTSIMELVRDKKVFVYGTLKRGYHNSSLLKDATFLGKAVTKKKWTMIGKNMPFPYVMEQLDTIGNNVVGEVFAVNSKEMSSLNRLEGVPHHYVSQEIDVVYTDDNSEDKVLLYRKSTVNKEYRTNNTILTEWGE